jgi:hypothetical protein
MCFGALTSVGRCERCGRRHPADFEERCLELAAADGADGLDEELAGYLASAEARFFCWLAQRD